MGKLRSIDTDIWTDIWFENLNTEEKLLFIYLVTNDKTNMLGVYETSLRKMAFETGISNSNTEKYINRFISDNKILYISNRIVLVNFLKHQRYNTNMMKSAIDCYNKLPIELKIKGLETLSKDSEGFGRLSKHWGMVPKIEVEVEVEIEVEIEIENKEKYLLEKETKYTSLNFRNDLLDFGFKENLIEEWLQVRKNKKSTNSKTALSRFINQVNLHGGDKNEILEECVSKSWTSFNSTWNIDVKKPIDNNYFNNPMNGDLKKPYKPPFAL